MAGGEGVGSSLNERLFVTAGCAVPEGVPSLFVGIPPTGARVHSVWRLARPFPHDIDGKFAEALPETDAIAQLEDMRRSSPVWCLIVPGVALGWLAARHGLTWHLQGRYGLLADDESCRIFDLREPPITPFVDSVLDPDEPVMTLVRERSQLALGDRHVFQMHSADEIGRPDPGNVRFLVVPDVAPWAPDDPGVLRALERRYRKIASRPGICEMFDLSNA